MGRRRASRRSTLQRIHRIKHDREKGLETFKEGLASRQDIEEALRIYHDKHVDPLYEFLNYQLSPWWKRAWWRTKEALQKPEEES